MVVKYVLNRDRGVLHIQTCFAAKNIFHSQEYYVLKDILASYPGKVKCCKRCLAKDIEAKELVEAHNHRSEKL